jgi:hypothetical protein
VPLLQVSRGLAQGWQPDGNLYEFAIKELCEEGKQELALDMLNTMQVRFSRMSVKRRLLTPDVEVWNQETEPQLRWMQAEPCTSLQHAR